MKATPKARVDRYLDDLRRATADLPAQVQQELIADVGAHIDAALGELDGAGDEEVRRVLADVGDPLVIAAEARDTTGTGTGTGEVDRPGVLPVIALAAACLSLLVPMFGTLVAIAVVWGASRGAHTPRARTLVRVAAVVVAAVAVVHLTFFFLGTPTAVEGEGEVRLVPGYPPD